ncbi:nuclear factor of activated T-cells, cytoplasmic 3-like isoform X1 [Paramormyrops kingsleyae]|uniref:nuclear factor of activated T-cells, cytoplasmic 3-like isoform X1 n=1 Tax=Paramormyrops kingsleyae TaxID=1676925 RepID=UPI003B96CE2D
MTAADCRAGEDLDFRLLFGDDGQQQTLGPADLEPDDSTPFYILSVGHPTSAGNLPPGIACQGAQTSSPVASAAPQLHGPRTCDLGYGVQTCKYNSAMSPKAFECPSIQITSISPNFQQDFEANDDGLQVKGPKAGCREHPSGRDQLYLPVEHSYRDTSLSPSPCSSISSRSWFSDASSCESFSHVYDDVDSELNEATARFTLGSPLASPLASPRCSPQAGPAEEPWQLHLASFPPPPSPRQSPCHSPRTSVTDENWLSPRPSSRPSSRPTSPCGKRRHSSADICYPGSASPHHSPTPTPGHSPRGSVTEDTWAGSTSLGGSPFQCCPSELDIPSKTRKTSQDQTALLADSGLEDACCVSPSLDSPVEDVTHSLKKDVSGEHFLSVPSHFTWSKPKPGHTPIFRASSLPPLDWPLPSQFGQYELKIEVHPKAHHRAHYETEGSRGAVKASTGGHPVVKLIGYNEKPVSLQMFIGTADDRYLRPHAFYQVHRITGKTVATASQEIIISSTKVLEIPLLPENNMSASIDCAGILKLRNSDIELRKGETDIGRKNTRVRVVFRVHIPQPAGKVLSLQAASIPVECSQRSAQELPHVEKSSPNSCSVDGGEEVLITGSNFFPETKVIFLEKGPDGRSQWEVEARVIREKSQGCNIVVEVPPYHSKAASSAIQVQFYACNGKRKRSQAQRFTYLPVSVKQEHKDEADLSSTSLPLAQPTSVPGLHPARALLLPPDPVPQHGGLPPGLLPGKPSLQALYSQMSSCSFQLLAQPPCRGLPPGPDCPLIRPPLAFPAPPGPQQRPPYQALPHSLMNSCQPSVPLSTAPAPAFQQLSLQTESSASQLLAFGAGFTSSATISGSASPSVPGQPLIPASPSVPGQPLIPASPSVPGQPLIPASPSVPGQPLIPASPSVPGQPLIPSIPSVPGQPLIPASPSFPGQPLIPASPPVPGQPLIPASPSFPGQPPIPASPQFHSLGFPCPTPAPVSSPPLPVEPPQLQHPLGYHPPSQGSASFPSSNTAPLSMGSSPHSGPSSPQLQSLPYQSPTPGSASSPSPTSSSPLMHFRHSGQPPAQAASPIVGSQVCPLAPQGERMNIKQESEGKELAFNAIGLQDITLDDVNEIIGRDMSQAPAGSHSQS